MTHFLKTLSAVTLVAALAAPVMADKKTATATPREGFASDGGLGGTRIKGGKSKSSGFASDGGLGGTRVVKPATGG